MPAVDAPTPREMQLALPKNIRLVGVPSGYTEIFQQDTDWIERLSGLSQRESWFANTSPNAAVYFRLTMVVPTSGDTAKILLRIMVVGCIKLCVATAVTLSLSFSGGVHGYSAGGVVL